MMSPFPKPDLFPSSELGEFGAKGEDEAVPEDLDGPLNVVVTSVVDGGFTALVVGSDWLWLGG